MQKKKASQQTFLFLSLLFAILLISFFSYQRLSGQAITDRSGSRTSQPVIATPQTPQTSPENIGDDGGFLPGNGLPRGVTWTRGVSDNQGAPKCTQWCADVVATMNGKFGLFKGSCTDATRTQHEQTIEATVRNDNSYTTMCDTSQTTQPGINNNARMRCPCPNVGQPPDSRGFTCASQGWREQTQFTCEQFYENGQPKAYNLHFIATCGVSCAVSALSSVDVGGEL